MNIKTAQELVKDEFATIRHPRIASYIALSEEVGEIADLIMKKEFYNEPISKEALAGECADTLICLLELAENYDIDLEQSFIKKIDELRPRIKKWADLEPILKEKRDKHN